MSFAIRDNVVDDDVPILGSREHYALFARGPRSVRQFHGPLDSSPQIRERRLPTRTRQPSGSG